MKKIAAIVIAVLCALMVSGCGVVPIADGASTLSVRSKKAKKVTVYVDGQRHDVKTVPEKKADNVRQTTRNTIEIPEGNHEVTVKKDDQQIHKETVKTSGEGHNVVELKEEPKDEKKR